MEHSWNLKNYFYESLEDKSYILDKKNISSLIDNFISKYRGKIKTISNNSEMLTFLKDEEELDLKISKVINYTSMLYYQNSEDEKIQEEIMELEAYMDILSEKLLFVQEEIKALGEEALLNFSKAESLKKYENYFYQIAQNLKHQLSPEVEKALLISNQSLNQVKLYEDLTSSYEFEFRNGKLSEDELLSKLELPDENIRKEAYLILSHFYQNKERKTTHASIYTSVIKNHLSTMKLRNYKTPISIQNSSEELSDESVEIMLTTIMSYSQIYQDYLKLRKKILGIDELNVWDVYAPIRNDKKKISFEESQKIILEVVNNFNPKQANFIRKMIEEERIDTYPKKGKTQGAFALYSKEQESFILLNHTNNLSSLYTFIHELGHAYHGSLSQIQPSQCFESPLVLAETASIFNELLLSKHLEKTLSKEEQITQLVRELDETCGNVFKQIQYVLFEQKVYTNVLNGEEYTAKKYSKEWRSIGKQFCGNVIKYYEKEDEETSWQRIPHLYRSPFYCYSYAFGNLLSLALFSQYKRGDRDFVTKYEKLLSSGGSKTPYHALKDFGFDIESREFYKLGLEEIKKKLERLKKLV